MMIAVLSILFFQDFPKISILSIAILRKRHANIQRQYWTTEKIEQDERILIRQ
jgi:hypothetical protein